VPQAAGPTPAGCPAGWLSEQEIAWSESLEPSIRWRYRRSRALLRQRLAGLLGIAVEAVPLHSPPGEAPQLQGDHGCLSLSHSGACLLLAWSPWPIGVDLEHGLRPLAAAALQRRFFPPQEQRQLDGLGEEALRQAVLRSWVHKEAAIKWRRRQLATELRFWRFDHLSGSLLHTAEDLRPECVSAAAGPWLWAAVGRGVGLLGGPKA
jgi:phosphopantetheinyl transferase